MKPQTAARIPAGFSTIIRFYDATLGKKAVMAVTGLILFAYVLGHMMGNLLIFSPHHTQINHYAAFLHSNVNVLPLWTIRGILFAAVVLHIVAALQLAKIKNDARPVAYIKKNDPATTYAARTMIWSGPIIAAFIVFHVLHLTAGKILPLHEIDYRQPDVRYNIVSGFHHRPVALFYIFAMALLCLHLYHGLWSMLQSLGWIAPRHLETVRIGSAAFAILVCAGFASVPLAVMAGVIKF